MRTAIAFLHGFEVPRDYAQALRWLTSAAEAGASRAVLNLGTMYENGLGVDVDLPRAFQLYRRSAERGEWLAYVHLARMYRDGRGTSVDTQAALDWYEAALSEASKITPCPELTEASEYVRTHGKTG